MEWVCLCRFRDRCFFTIHCRLACINDNAHRAYSDALEQAIWHRGNPEGLIHHSDRGSQYLSIRYTERLAEAGIQASVGSVGDSYDNALAETINGLFKTEIIRRNGPWKNVDAVEYATLEWVNWFNNQRLLSSIGYISPAQYETDYYDNLNESGKVA